MFSCTVVMVFICRDWLYQGKIGDGDFDYFLYDYDCLYSMFIVFIRSTATVTHSMGYISNSYSRIQ